ncbi:hypothetical protein ACWDBW_37880 [Streptomyces sp. NPDC001107]
MLAFSGLGCLPIALLGALSVIWFRIIDARGGDWATACLVAVPFALVLGLVDLVAAESLNRAPDPGRLPEGDETVWTSRHRAGGTPLQCFSPYFLAAAGLFCVGWTIQWVHWGDTAPRPSPSPSAAGSRVLDAGPSEIACRLSPGAGSPPPCNACTSHRPRC